MPTETARINNQKQKKQSDMKRYRLIEYAYLATLVLGFTACSQDELVDGLPMNGTPVTFTASGIAMQQSAATRATTDGTWEADMTVGIKISGMNSELPKAYTVKPNADDNTKATLAAADAANPFYWQSSTEPVAVTAWWPYADDQTEPSEVIVEADQSTRANYDASDYIMAQQDVKYSEPTLTFEHRTAKVTINIKMSVESSTASVSDLKLCNLTGVKDGATQVTPYQPDKNVATFEALLPEQTIAAGTQFLSLQLDGHSFTYTWTASQDYELKAGYNTIFTFTLANKDIVFEGCTLVGWLDGQGTQGNTGPSTLDFIVEDGTYKVYTEAGLKVWADHVKAGHWSTNLTLMNDIIMTSPASGSSNWTPIGRSSQTSLNYTTYTGTIEGNGYTIDNMVVNEPNSYRASMVVALGVGGTIRNLTIGSGSHFSSRYYASSVVVDNNGGKVINCHSAATVEGLFLSGVSGMDFSVGGVVANNWSDDGKNSYVIGCSFSGQVIADANNLEEYFFVGGVVGSNRTAVGNNSNRAHVVGCINTGGVTFKNAGSSTVSHVGGVVGSNYQNHGLAVVTGCVMTGKMTFSNVEKRKPWYSAFDATIGEIEDATATHVYYTGGSIESEWSNPYRTTYAKYDALLEVDGIDITWETATANINTAIKEWNADNGDLCPYHFEQTNGTNQPPTLVDGMP